MGIKNTIQTVRLHEMTATPQRSHTPHTQHLQRFQNEGESRAQRELHAAARSWRCMTTGLMGQTRQALWFLCLSRPPNLFHPHSVPWKPCFVASCQVCPMADACRIWRGGKREGLRYPSLWFFPLRLLSFSNGVCLHDTLLLCPRSSVLGSLSSPLWA